MIGNRLISRIAIFSALVYLFGWATSFLPNVSLAFFVIFSAGVLWGTVPGMLVGLCGMGLFSAFNPYGPAPIPIMLTQMVGASLSGVVGGSIRKTSWSKWNRGRLLVALSLAALVCTMAYYLPVSAVDAWLFQPFWPRFVTGMIWSLWALGSNLLIFLVLFGATRHLYLKEQKRP